MIAGNGVHMSIESLNTSIKRIRHLGINETPCVVKFGLDISTLPQSERSSFADEKPWTVKPTPWDGSVL